MNGSEADIDRGHPDYRSLYRFRQAVHRGHTLMVYRNVYKTFFSLFQKTGILRFLHP